MRTLPRMGKIRLPRPVRRASLVGLLVLAMAGCTRSFFRTHADSDVENILTEKNTCPAWAIEHWHAYPDPRARFADPTDPDHPAKPPDDPAAANNSPYTQHPYKAGITRVEGKGYLALLAQWDKDNRLRVALRDAMAKEKEKKESGGTTTATGRGLGPVTPGVAGERKPGEKSAAGPPSTSYIPEGKPRPPEPRAKPLEEPGNAPHPYLLTLEQSCELGMFNSREFQDRREDLYLACLPVTLERFGFAAQWQVLSQTIRQWAGAGTPVGARNDWQFNNTVGFSKLFSTGALMLFSFANQTVVQMTGPNRGTTSVSFINLDFIQPFLRAGGKAVTLEPLTQAERDLLYEIRAYARFRKEFFVAVAGGGGGSISGGTFVPTGVVTPQALRVIGRGIGGSALFPGVTVLNNPTAITNLPTPPGGAGRLPLPSAIPPNVSGYLGTLLQWAQIAFDQENIDKLEDFMKLFRATLEGGDIAQLQVNQLEQQLLGGYTTLYSDQQQYMDSIDRFKQQLGLPMIVPIELDDTPIRPVIEQFRRYERVIREFADTAKLVTHAESQGKAALPETGVRAELRRLTQTAAIVQGTRFRTQIQGRWAVWERLSNEELRDRLRKYAEERRKLLDAKAAIEIEGKVFPAAQEQRLRQLTYDIDLGSLERTLREYERRPWRTEANPERRRLQQAAMYRVLADAFLLVVVEARTERIESLRKMWPEVPGLCVSGKDMLEVDLEEAMNTASIYTLQNRLDLMNARAEVVDAWREIRVFANALLGVFNVEYQLNANTPLNGAQPINFGASRTNQRLLFNAQLPLVRRLERNNYRAALISYQRLRRTLQEAEDLSVYVVRGEIRQLRVLAETYKIQQRQTELAYLVVENSLDVFQQPPQAGVATDTATRAATLVNQLLTAQRQVPLTQNALLTAWINYQNTRLQLYRDLELMPLDPRGVWTDDQAACFRNSGACCGKPADGARPETESRRADDKRPVPKRGGDEDLPLPRPLPRTDAPGLEPAQ